MNSVESIEFVEYLCKKSIQTCYLLCKKPVLHLHKEGTGNTGDLRIDPNLCLNDLSDFSKSLNFCLT